MTQKSQGGPVFPDQTEGDDVRDRVKVTRDRQSSRWIAEIPGTQHRYSSTQKERAIDKVVDQYEKEKRK